MTANTSSQQEPADRADDTKDTLLHILARDFQWLLRSLCVGLLIATVVFMATFWYAAIPSVILLLLCYILLVFVNGLEHSTDVYHTNPETYQTDPGGTPARPTGDERRQQETTKAIERRLTWIALEVVGGAAVLTTALVLLVFGFNWEVLPIAGLALLGYIILVTSPVWLAWMESDTLAEVERRRAW